MASKRQRGSKWEYTFKKAGVLDSPLYLTFDDEKEGDLYAKRIEALLDKGIVPTEYTPQTRILTVAQLIAAYMRGSNVKDKDQGVLGTVANAKGRTPLSDLTAAWVDNWVTEMKRVENLAPGTIRAKVGAMARCTDWGVRKGHLALPGQPFRSLPIGYAQYTPADTAHGEKRVDVERDRRLEFGEWEKILAVIDKGVIHRDQRPLKLEHQKALKTFATLAVESAMRMREMYTLTVPQVDMAKRTIFLDKTKNGDKRQVPMSSVALAVMKDYMAGLDQGQLVIFPWWCGSPMKSKLKRVSDDLSKLYRKIFEEAGCAGLKFHDLRHEAVSRLFERTTLSETEIMKISGHKSHRMLMRYTNLRGSSLSDKLW